MKKINLIVLFISLIAGSIVAQNDLYQTKFGTLQIYGEFQGEDFIGTSNELRVSLDYETTEIVFKLNLNKLKFNVDSLNKIIETIEQEIVFKGTLSLDHINTDEHPPLNFTMEGWTEINNRESKIEGTGQLHHRELSKDSSCMLGIIIILNLNDFGVNVPSLKEEIKIVIKQVILNKGTN